MPWTSVCVDAISPDFCQYWISVGEDPRQLPRRDWGLCVFIHTLLIHALAPLSRGWFLSFLIEVSPNGQKKAQNKQEIYLELPILPLELTNLTLYLYILK